VCGYIIYLFVEYETGSNRVYHEELMVVLATSE